ncbi:hypothetical protein AcidC75_19560 [Acidisoma sp. C75]
MLWSSWAVCGTAAEKVTLTAFPGIMARCTETAPKLAGSSRNSALCRPPRESATTEAARLVTVSGGSVGVLVATGLVVPAAPLGAAALVTGAVGTPAPPIGVTEEPV